LLDHQPELKFYFALVFLGSLNKNYDCGVDSTISITHDQSLSAPKPGCLAADIACASDSEHHVVALQWQGHEATINKCSFYNGGFTLDPSFVTKDHATLSLLSK